MSGEQHPIFTSETNRLTFAILKAALYPTQSSLTEDDKATINSKIQQIIDIPENSSQKYIQLNSSIIGFYAGYLNIESKAVRQYAKNNKEEILEEIKKPTFNPKTDKIVNLTKLIFGAMRWLWFFHPHDECDDITFVGWYRETAEKQLAVLEAEAKKKDKDLFSSPASDWTIENITERNTFVQLLLTAQDYRPNKLRQISKMMNQLRAPHKTLPRKVEKLYLLLYYYSNLVRQLMSMPPLTRSA